MYNYTNLTFTELVNKIGSSRYWNLPAMLKEILSRLAPQSPKYKVYTALLTQSGTDAPVATVLENTLGDIVWSYASIGTYNAALEGAFILNKTSVKIGSFDALSSSYGYFSFTSESQPDIYILQSYDLTDLLADNILANTLIEIRVYN